MTISSTFLKSILSADVELRLDTESESESEPNSYITSYPFMIEALQGHVIDAKRYVLAAHMVYGWMPTILTLVPGGTQADFSVEAAILERTRKGGVLTGLELELLAKSVNNSIIGASKLLHFVRPDRYAIWDTKVCAFLIHGSVRFPVPRPPHSTVNRVALYQQYQSELSKLFNEQSFNDAHQRVNKTLGYDVTAMRAAELLMFTNAPKFIGNKKKN